MSGPALSGYVADVCWSVEERAWKQDLPHLADDDDVIMLLATPVIVTASAWAGSAPPRDPASNVRVLAPAPPYNRRRGVPRAAARTA